MSSFELSVRAELTHCSLIPVRADSTGLTQLKKKQTQILDLLSQKGICQTLQANCGRMFCCHRKSIWAIAGSEVEGRRFSLALSPFTAPSPEAR
jgi:hypothetical protein